jgi:hypothetical protein
VDSTDGKLKPMLAERRTETYASLEWTNFLYEQEQGRKLITLTKLAAKKQEKKEFRIFLIYCMLLERYFNTEHYLFQEG